MSRSRPRGGPDGVCFSAPGLLPRFGPGCDELPDKACSCPGHSSSQSTFGSVWRPNLGAPGSHGGGSGTGADRFGGAWSVILLHAEVQEVVVWRLASAAWAFAATIMMARDWLRLRAFSEPERALVSRRLLVAIYGAVILTVLLQATNRVHLHARWPLLVAVSVNLLIAFQEFVLLLFTGFRAA